VERIRQPLPSIFFIIGFAIVVTIPLHSKLETAANELTAGDRRNPLPFDCRGSKTRLSADSERIFSISYVNEAYCRFRGKSGKSCWGRAINLIREDDHSLLFQAIATLTPSNPPWLLRKKQAGRWNGGVGIRGSCAFF
jgi:hypothetical protein